MTRYEWTAGPPRAKDGANALLGGLSMAGTMSQAAKSPHPRNFGMQFDDIRLARFLPPHLQKEFDSKRLTIHQRIQLQVQYMKEHPQETADLLAHMS